MTQEEKAKAYDEALERARALNNGKDVDVEAGTTTCEYIFPELKESEDEKIKELLKHYLEVRRCQTKDNEEYINCNHFLAWLEKQGEQPKEITCTHEVETGNGNIKASVTEKIQPLKFKVKYAGSEYKVLDIKVIAGITYYGIEDEPNHIDYVLPENCEVINGYGIKERGSSYPIKPVVFLDENPAWSEEDERIALGIEQLCNCASFLNISPNKIDRVKQWLKSLKERIKIEQNVTSKWRPSNAQIKALEHFVRGIGESGHVSPYDANLKLVHSLLNDLKKLK